MSTNSQDQEIDLGQIGTGIKNFFNGIVNSVFDFIFFVKKKLVIIVGLFVVGVVLGYFLDQNTKKYTSEIIVAPNLGGSDYLYAKINLIKSKLKEDDKSFFKSIGISNTENILSIKIEPIIDIYAFVNTSQAIAENAQNTQNFELMRLLAESEDINKVIEDEKTSKNYPHHKISIITLNKIDDKVIIKPILKYLNSDEYLNKLLAITQENVLIKMKKNEEQILQVDNLITQISENLAKEKSTTSLVYNNENNEINALFTLKNGLINEIAGQKITLENIKLYIKDVSITTNIIESKGVNNKLKLFLPLVFILLYLFGYFFKSIYKKQSARINS
ncbi:hypothetical protein [Flavobacterium sp. UBA7663]|uniref:hypothetical protein n=1 Tax=Flavobacterium sp. UBA7663 TaxID=1946557 RepID=UPI0025C5DF0E|nr:hypothetical protein [Flavobacterium sp. UBA7663]